MHSTFHFRRHIPTLAGLVACLLLLSCASPKKAPPLPEVNMGVAWFTQPQETADLLAGFLPENTPRVEEKYLGQLDAALDEVLLTQTKRSYVGPGSFPDCKDVRVPGKTASNRVAALHYWVAVGKCMGVDFLLVPQIIDLRERDGSEAGVVTPAGVTMDMFLIDVRNGVLVTRSHFDEVQGALADNLLDAGKFVSRGGKWISAVELAQEGMVKAVEDLGL